MQQPRLIESKEGVAVRVVKCVASRHGRRLRTASITQRFKCNERRFYHLFHGTANGAFGRFLASLQLSSTYEGLSNSSTSVTDVTERYNFPSAHTLRATIRHGCNVHTRRCHRQCRGQGWHSAERKKGVAKPTPAVHHVGVRSCPLMCKL